VEIAKKCYDVYIKIADAPLDGVEKNYMSDITLVFNTNGDSKRSHNPGAARDILSSVVKVFINGKVFYEAGYIKQRRWYYTYGRDAVAEFKYTVAHEIGHEILQASVDTLFSYTHKGSSTLWQTAKGEQFSDNIEIDLMKYYKDKEIPPNYYKRRVAAKEDVLRLIGLIKVGAK